MENIKILLTCLGYPSINNINLFMRNDLIRLVCWLEDRKIRELEIAARNELRKDSSNWESEFGKYLQILNCPYDYSSETTIDCLTWLISFAIALEYEDCANDCSEMELKLSENMEIEENSDLLNAFNDLGSIVSLNRLVNESQLDYLKRIIQKVNKLLSSTHNAKCNDNSNSAAPTQTELNTATSVKLSDFPLGFDTGDNLVNQIAVILKMLHIHDFRELQNDLNSLIVLGQEFTANPRTNAALGKVGF